MGKLEAIVSELLSWVLDVLRAWFFVDEDGADAITELAYWLEVEA